ncbi:hypothetical protein GCM10022631_24510 [Deinococcus rubellus]|uniref:hypothetical protein n=1 Tax=Deinococcus rubellus TaxID=1889240 RepID=UPI0031E960AE
MTEISKQRGRRLIFWVVILSFGSSLLVSISLLVMSGSVNIRDLIRLGLTGLLLWQVYLGKSWARILAVVLFALGGLVSLGSAAVALMTLPSQWVIPLLGLGVVDIACALILGISKDVRAYFAQVTKTRQAT